MCTSHLWQRVVCNIVIAGTELTSVNMNNTVARESVWRDVIGQSWERSTGPMLKEVR